MYVTAGHRTGGSGVQKSINTSNDDFACIIGVASIHIRARSPRGVVFIFGEAINFAVSARGARSAATKHGSSTYIPTINQPLLFIRDILLELLFSARAKVEHAKHPSGVKHFSN